MMRHDAMGHGLHKRGMVAIYKHLIQRYDRDNMEHLVFSRHKDGTKRFEAYGNDAGSGEAGLNRGLGRLQILF